jgi:acetyl esterase
MTPFNARQVSPVTDAVMAVLTKQNKPPLEPVFNVAHRLIPGGSGQQLLIRIYQPAGDGPFPALVYYHGGGWVIANLETYDASCRALTNAANCAVISVAYRQGPEYRYPAAHNDAFAAYQWVLANAAAIRVDPNKVAIGGESAGGNLAAATTLMARDRGIKLPVHQMLVYPIANYGFDTASYNENAMAMPLSKPLMQWFFRNYLRRAADGASPYISLLRANTSGLPPATVITAQVDPLRDEGEAYGQKLKDAGVPVTVTRYDGVTHEFFSMGAIIDKAKAANAEAATALKQAFGTA